VIVKLVLIRASEQYSPHDSRHCTRLAQCNKILY